VTKLELKIRDHKVNGEIESYLEIARIDEHGTVHSRVAVRRVDFPRFIEQLREQGRKLIGAEEIAELMPHDISRAQRLVGVGGKKR